MHICDYGVRFDIFIIHACILNFKNLYFEECTYNTNKYWPYLNDFLLGQEIINLGPVSPVA